MPDPMDDTPVIECDGCEKVFEMRWWPLQGEHGIWIEPSVWFQVSIASKDLNGGSVDGQIDACSVRCLLIAVAKQLIPGELPR